jgi:hypothetical protein
MRTKPLDCGPILRETRIVHILAAVSDIILCGRHFIRTDLNKKCPEEEEVEQCSNQLRARSVSW